MVAFGFVAAFLGCGGDATVHPDQGTTSGSSASTTSSAEGSSSSATETSGSTVEICDGLDNDQDAYSADGSGEAQYLKTCGDQACGPRLWRCSQGHWQCELLISLGEPSKVGGGHAKSIVWDGTAFGVATNHQASSNEQPSPSYSRLSLDGTLLSQTKLGPPGKILFAMRDDDVVRMAGSLGPAGNELKGTLLVSQQGVLLQSHAIGSAQLIVDGPSMARGPHGLVAAWIDRPNPSAAHAVVVRLTGDGAAELPATKVATIENPSSDPTEVKTAIVGSASGFVFAYKSADQVVIEALDASATPTGAIRSLGEHTSTPHLQLLANETYLAWNQSNDEAVLQSLAADGAAQGPLISLGKKLRILALLNLKDSLAALLRRTDQPGLVLAQLRNAKMCFLAPLSCNKPDDLAYSPAVSAASDEAGHVGIAYSHSSGEVGYVRLDLPTTAELDALDQCH